MPDEDGGRLPMGPERAVLAPRPGGVVRRHEEGPAGRRGEGQDKEVQVCARWKKIDEQRVTFAFSRYLHDAKASLAGRLLLRLFCARALERKEGHDGGPLVVLGRSDKGRPRLEGRPEWDFNVSHQGDYVVLAAERGKPGGVRSGILRSVFEEGACCRFRTGPPDPGGGRRHENFGQ